VQCVPDSGSRMISLAKADCSRVKKPFPPEWIIAHLNTHTHPKNCSNSVEKLTKMRASYVPFGSLWSFSRCSIGKSSTLAIFYTKWNDQLCNCHFYSNPPPALFSSAAKRRQPEARRPGLFLELCQ
jgi:hypothetical protein